MDLQKFQEKLIRRVTSPGEVFYVISSHALLILFLAVTGGVVLWAEKSSGSLLYEADATLLLTPRNPTVAREFGGLSRREEGNFVNEQIQILRSSTVTKYVVQGLSYDEISPHDVEDESEDDAEDFGSIRKIHKSVKAKWEKVVKKLSPPTAEGSLRERKTLRAMANFKKRSGVQPDRDSNIVRLTVHGTERERLSLELDAWIAAYRKRIGELTRDAFERVLLERTGYWDKEIADAKADLERFRTENEDVSETMQGWLQMQIMHYQAYSLALTGQSPVSAATAGLSVPFGEGTLATPELTLLRGLRARQQSLAAQRLALVAKYPERSKSVEFLDEESRLVAQRIAEISSGSVLSDGPATSGTPAASESPPTVSGQPADTLSRKNQTESVDEKLQNLLIRKQKLDNKLGELQRLDAAHREALNEKRQVEQLLVWSTEASEGRRVVQSIELDKPIAGIKPINGFQPIHILFGAGCGAVAGLLLAFCIELFSRRVIFKSDVIHQLDLEVIGIFPER